MEANNNNNIIVVLFSAITLHCMALHAPKNWGGSTKADPMSIGIIIPSWASPIIVLLASTSAPVFVPVPAKHTPFDVVVLWSVCLCVWVGVFKNNSNHNNNNKTEPTLLFICTYTCTSLDLL